MGWLYLVHGSEILTSFVLMSLKANNCWAFVSSFSVQLSWTEINKLYVLIDQRNDKQCGKQCFAHRTFCNPNDFAMMGALSILHVEGNMLSMAITMRCRCHFYHRFAPRNRNLKHGFVSITITNLFRLSICAMTSPCSKFKCLG